MKYNNLQDTIKNNAELPNIVKAIQDVQNNFSNLNSTISKSVITFKKQLLTNEVNDSLNKINSFISSYDTIVNGILQDKTFFKIYDIAKSFDSFTLKLSLSLKSIKNSPFKDLQKITQTFYGLQFSTTFTSQDKIKRNEEPVIDCNMQISYTEHRKILSEKDYIIQSQQNLIYKVTQENKQLRTIKYNSEEQTIKQYHKKLTSNGGKKSYSKYEDLRVKIVPDLCKIIMDNNDIHVNSARELSERVAKTLKEHHLDSLKDFAPYNKKDGTDWIRTGTFYNWCNTEYKKYK